MPVSDAGAFAEALTAVAGVAKPFLDEHLAQRYETQEREKLAGWQAAVRAPNANFRVPVFVDGVLGDAGKPVGAVGDTSIEIPIDFLDNLVQCAIAYARMRRELASMLAAIKK